MARASQSKCRLVIRRIPIRHVLGVVASRGGRERPPGMPRVVALLLKDPPDATFGLLRKAHLDGLPSHRRGRLDLHQFRPHLSIWVVRADGGCWTSSGSSGTFCGSSGRGSTGAEEPNGQRDDYRGFALHIKLLPGSYSRRRHASHHMRHSTPARATGGKGIQAGACNDGVMDGIERCSSGRQW